MASHSSHTTDYAFARIAPPCKTGCFYFAHGFACRTPAGEPVYNTKNAKDAWPAYTPVPRPGSDPPRRYVAPRDRYNPARRFYFFAYLYLSVSVRYIKMPLRGMPLRRNPGVSVQFSVERVVTIDSSNVLFISNHDGRWSMHDAQNGNAT